MTEKHPLQWSCPHCEAKRLELKDGLRHLSNHHSACLSCRAERLLLIAMMEGRGWTVPLTGQPHGKP